MDVLLQTATATAAEQSARQGEQAEEEQGALTEALRAAPAASYPRIAALGEDLVSGAPEERLSWMFRVVVNGTLATPRPA